MLKKEPLTGNKSRPSPDPLARPQTTIKQLGSLETFLKTEEGDLPTAPQAQAWLIQFLGAGSPQDSTVPGDCQVLERKP